MNAVKVLERYFENALWNSRFVVVLAVVASLAAGFAVFFMATVMLIFSLGLYELFISDIDPAKGSKASSRVLVIHDLDDLKGRLAKVIVMILIVSLFEHALKMQMAGPVDLLYFGGSIALIGLALFLMHKGESHPATKGGQE